jgi:hypothetical protein
MGLGSQILEALMARSEFGETVEWRAASSPDGSYTSLTGRVDRQAGSEIVERENGWWAVTRAFVRVFASAHTTYGGVTSPAIGDDWKIGKTLGASARTTGWKAGLAEGGDGWWKIPLTLEERQITAGKREGA